MMLYPSIDKLLEQVDSKYSMVILSSKRAHELHGRSEPLLDHYQSYKNVGRALEEVVAGELEIDPNSIIPERSPNRHEKRLLFLNFKISSFIFLMPKKSEKTLSV